MKPAKIFTALSLVLSLGLVSLAACASQTTGTPTVQPTNPPSTSPVSKPSSTTPAGTAQPSPAITAMSLEVTEPVNDSIVEQDQVEIKGRTSPGVVVSAGDEITIADEQGAFVLPVTLEDGINLIDVIASDESGNEARVTLTVTWTV